MGLWVLGLGLRVFRVQGLGCLGSQAFRLSAVGFRVHLSSTRELQALSDLRECARVLPCRP